MERKFNLLQLAVAVIAIQLLSTGKANATVGGPTYISDISYNPLNDMVYYFKHDNGGRGCPPIINAIDTITNLNTEVKTCDEVFEEYNLYSDTQGDERYSQYIYDFLKPLTDINSINLKKNNIDITVDSLSEHIESGEKFWTEFRATVFQDNKEIAKIDFTGCDKEQPHVFEGYMIPNTNTLALLISTKGNCFEGGYIRETLHLINNIKYYDATTIRGYKEAAATEPNIGNIVIFASQKPGSQNAQAIPTNVQTVKPPLQSKYLANMIGISSGIILFFGVFLGYLLGKRAKRL